MRQGPHFASFIAFFLALVVVPAPYRQTPETGSTYVHVSPRDHRYLELTDGTPYIPIGLNIVAPPYNDANEGEALHTMETWLANLSANGGNYGMRLMR